MLKTIGNRIIFSFSLLIITLVLSLLIFFNNILKEAHLTVLKREMKEKAQFIELSLPSGENPAQKKLSKNIKKAVDNIAKIIGLRVTIVDFNGKVTADSSIDNVKIMDNHKSRIEIRDAMAEGYGEIIRYSSTLDIDMLYYAKKSEECVIRLAKPLYEVDETLGRVKKTIILSGSIALILSIIIIIIYARKITRPIKETIDFAEDFSNGDFSKRIDNYSSDEIGTLQRSLNSLADIITEKIESLMLEKTKLKTTIETIHDGIAVIDNSKKIIIANRSFNSLLNIHRIPDNLTYSDIIKNPSLNTKIQECIDSGDSIEFEEKLLNEKVYYVYINPIKEEAGIQGILIVLHDITERKKNDQMKTDLVGNISHELKTPIAIIKGYLETIEDSISDEEMAKEFISKAIVNLDRQNSIINDMLKLNLLETAPDFPEEKINIKEIIEGCIDILHQKASAKEIDIVTDLDLTYIKISGSKFLTEEIFFNIIENAINYNKAGGQIRITSAKEGGKIKIIISDTGIGIPQDSIDRIFERFYRVDKSRSRSTGGTGLGLSIVKHAAGILGWDISVHSGKEGTTFTIVLS